MINPRLLGAFGGFKELKTRREVKFSWIGLGFVSSRMMKIARFLCSYLILDEELKKQVLEID